MELIIVRHARPERVDDAGGPADPPLTDIGHSQAQAMADWLRTEALDALYVSPMARARQTSTPLEEALDMEATVVDGVREFDGDEPHYIPMEELKADREAWRAWLKEHGEATRDEFNAEVVRSLTDIVAANRGRRVAVVCHGGVINSWASSVLGLNGAMFFAPDYTSINRFQCASTGERSIVSLNDIGHLRHRPELILSL